MSNNAIWTHGEAVERAESLARLVPAPWGVRPIGSPHAGFRLAISSSEDPWRIAYLANDDDFRHLLKLYVETVTEMGKTLT